MTEILGNVIVAVLALVGTLSGAYTANRKSTALLEYKLSQLEDKVSAHNHLVERMYEVEDKTNLLTEKISVANHRIDDLEHRKD